MDDSIERQWRFYGVFDPLILPVGREKPTRDRLLPQTTRFRTAQPKQNRDLANGVSLPE